MTREREEREVRGTLRSLESPSPRPDFQERMRREFVSGSIEGTLDRGSSASNARNVSTRIIPMVVALAAAATVLFVFLSEKASRSRPYVLVPAEVTNDVPGPTFSPKSNFMTGPDQTLNLQCSDWVSLQIAPNSEVNLPEVPGRFFERHVSGRVLRGELRAVTGKSFLGTTLQLSTPNATIDVTGTTFAVIAGPDSTCLCVLEGEAVLVDQMGKSHKVSSGRRVTAFGNNRPGIDEGILPMEQMKLEMLRDSAFQK